MRVSAPSVLSNPCGPTILAVLKLDFTYNKDNKNKNGGMRLYHKVTPKNKPALIISHPT
jgi:hypothetical protein